MNIKIKKIKNRKMRIEVRNDVSFKKFSIMFTYITLKLGILNTFLGRYLLQINYTY